MKKLTIPFLLITFLLACAGKTTEVIPNGEEEGNGKKELLYRWEKERTSLLDYHNMVLIYGGGSHRQYKWDEVTIQPYVTYRIKAEPNIGFLTAFCSWKFTMGLERCLPKGTPIDRPINRTGGNWLTTTFNPERASAP